MVVAIAASRQWPLPRIPALPVGMRGRDVIRVLALCSGVGGLELGVRIALADSYRCLGYIEREAFSAAVIVARMADETLDRAPVWDSLESFTGELYRGAVDLVTAGFPCQPWSAAGQKRGRSDERWIWPEIVRILRDVRPRFAFLENVPGLLVHDGLGTVLGDLAELGVRCGMGCVFSSRSRSPAPSTPVVHTRETSIRRRARPPTAARKTRGRSRTTGRREGRRRSNPGRRDGRPRTRRTRIRQADTRRRPGSCIRERR